MGEFNMKFDLGLLEFVECDKDFDKLAVYMEVIKI